MALSLFACGNDRASFATPEATDGADAASNDSASQSETAPSEDEADSGSEPSEATERDEGSPSSDGSESSASDTESDASESDSSESETVTETDSESETGSETETATETDADGECAEDEDCEDGVCVAEQCLPCNATTHHGCESAAAGPLCKAGAEASSNECVACLTEDETWVGPTACGPDDSGLLQQVCSDGAWTDTTECTDAAACAESDPAQLGTTACGLNGRGLLEQSCVQGAWTDTAECVDADECEDETVGESETACGVGGNGRLQQTCVEGAWVTGELCIECDPAEDTYRCLSGASQRCEENGAWVLDETCGGETPACIESTGQCGLCTQNELTCLDSVTLGTCDASGAFVPSECEFACVDDACGGECVPEQQQCRSTFVPEVCDDEGEWTRLPDCAGGQACDTDTGECVGVPSITSFTLNTPSIAPGGSATLAWSVAGADTLSIDSGIGAVTGASTNITPAKQTTYTLTATNEAGSVTASVTAFIVSTGTVSVFRHYGTDTGDDAEAVLLDEANNRLLTLNGFDDNNSDFHPFEFYVAEHSLTDGTISDQTSMMTNHDYRSSFVRTPDGYLMTALSPNSEAAVVILNDDLEIEDYYPFVIDTAFYEFASDAAMASNGDIFLAGVSAPADSGYVARVESDLSDHDLELISTRTSAVVIDASDRVFIGGNDGVFNRYSTGNIATPSKTATMNADDDIADLALDPSGSVIAVGSNASGGFVAKFGADLGAHTWRVNLTGNQAMNVQRVAVDGAGNVFVAGQVDTASQEEDVVVRAYTAAGTALWGPIQRGSVETDFVNGIVVDKAGTVFVVGGAYAQMTGATNYNGGVDAFIMLIK